ncbi:hypothetical protein CT154_01760 [Komagataeibacter xylinus]|nr:hypothetical protein CT154_01760 [Komagataeibacter xylinus]SAY46754.1 hypothetical protein KRIGEM_03352 [Komagataeibacter rhaeticus]
MHSVYFWYFFFIVDKNKIFASFPLTKYYIPFVITDWGAGSSNEIVIFPVIFAIYMMNNFWVIDRRCPDITCRQILLLNGFLILMSFIVLLNS